MWKVMIEYNGELYRVLSFKNKIELDEWMTFHISQFVNDKILTITIRKGVM